MGFRQNIVFFFGAYDLEMSYIRNLLDYCCVEYHNKRLNQDNANVSEYVKEIKAAIASGKRLYFVELAGAAGAREAYDYEDISVIDPHRSNQKPSIIQVYEMLGYTITRTYQLIAAYDTDGIPGMVGIGATQKEILRIQGEERAVKKI